jgi:hypothetical protein
VYHTRVPRGLRDQGVSNATWKGADRTIVFLDLSCLEYWVQFLALSDSLALQGKSLRKAAKKGLFCTFALFFKGITAQIIESFMKKPFYGVWR